LTIARARAMRYEWPMVQTITVFHRVNVDSDKVELNNEHEDFKWVRDPDDTMHPYLVDARGRIK